MPSPVRKTLLRVIGEADRASAKEVHSAMSLTKPRLKRRKRPGTRGQPAIVKIRWIDDKSVKGGGVYMGDGGDFYKPVEINGKTLMRREDGALFKLRRDGRWQHTIQKRSKKKWM